MNEMEAVLITVGLALVFSIPGAILIMFSPYLPLMNAEQGSKK